MNITRISVYRKNLTYARDRGNTTDLHSYNNESTGTPAPRIENGKLYASDRPGPGVKPDYDSLGGPVAVYA